MEGDGWRGGGDVGSGDGQWSYHKVAAQCESILIGTSHDRDIESLAVWVHEPLQPVRLGGVSLGRGGGRGRRGVGKKERERESNRCTNAYSHNYMYMMEPEALVYVKLSC